MDACKNKSARTVVLILGFFLMSNLSILAQIDVLADNSFVFNKDGVNIALPYFSSENIHQANDEITKIILVVHGTNRNADDYFDNMMSALRKRPEQSPHTLILAPQFLREDDIDAFKPGNDFAYWSSDGWKVGATSKDEDSNPRDIRISSYEVLDSLIFHLVSTFQKVDQLIFTGHSAGGQLTNRYTASSPIFSLLCDDFAISSKSIIANPGSYVYFSPMRRIPGSLDQFEIPNGCDEYNEYSYGLEDLYIYHSRVGEQQMKNWYETREIIYLFGSEDNDPNASTLPSSCRAQLQGAHRLEKGKIYFNHILDTFGEEIKQNQRMIIVPNVGHNNFNIYNSEEGLTELFDTPFVHSCGATTSTLENRNLEFTTYPNPADDHIFIFVGNLLLPSSQVLVYDVLGQLVFQQEVSKVFVKIDLTHLSIGTYFIRVHNGQSLGVQKFIKKL